MHVTEYSIYIYIIIYIYNYNYIYIYSVTQTLHMKHMQIHISHMPMSTYVYASLHNTIYYILSLRAVKAWVLIL